MEPTAPSPESCAEAFARIDKDGNGLLSRAEVILACRKDAHIRMLLGIPAAIHQEDGTRDTFERVFQGMDSNDNKLVDINEFTAYFRRAVTATSVPAAYEPQAQSSLAQPSSSEPLLQASVHQIPPPATELSSYAYYHAQPSPPAREGWAW